MYSKKIGILTFQETLNYGAMLQCFALNRFLNDLTYECQTINYKCVAVRNREMPFSFLTNLNLKKIIKGILSFVYKVRKRKVFQMFFDSSIVHSKKLYTRKTIKECSKLYDTIIVGSDQVWNPIVTGDDRTFFLDFVGENIKKLAYAASYGDKQYFDKYSNTYKDLINSFDAISVREKEAVLFSSTFCSKNVELVCDPVFLLPQDQWRKYEKAFKRNNEYILVYFIHYDYKKTMAKVKQFAKENHLDVIYINNTYRIEKDVINIRDASPEQFIFLIDKARLVVTGSFHGFSLSLIFNKPIYYEKTSSPTRVSEIASYVGMKDKIVQNISLEDVDYGNANACISNLVEKSKAFLINALK